MPNARDTELLNCIRSYDQSPPKCQFDHWGVTVFLPPELAKQFEAPARHIAFSSFFQQMLPHCRTFISACPGTGAEDPEEVLQAFIVSSLDLNPRLQTGRGFSRFFVHRLTP